MKPFDYQAAFLDDHWTRWAWVRKGRQVGWSQEEAYHGLMKAISLPRYRKIFTSLNLDDCKEKIDYANDLYDRLKEVSWLRNELPGKEVDRKTEIRFSNGARLISVFTPRGKAKADVSMDEFAYYQDPRKVYRAAMPILVHGGQLRIGSSPTHSQSMFSAIGRREGGKFTDFRRFEIFWWDCPIHCKDVEAARREIFDRTAGARLMATEDAVRKFGTEILLELFNNMLLEDFQQELENTESDDEKAFLSWDLIKACTPTGEDSISRYDSLEGLRSRTKDGHLWVGYDVGRRKDAAEITVFEERDAHLYERYRKTLKNTPFPIQAEELDSILHIPNVMGLAIDQTGMGEQLAEERVLKWGSKVVPVQFTNPMKGTMATNLKMLMEKSKVSFQADREAMFQMHSIKRLHSGNNVIYEVTSEKEGGYIDHHHADIFWARALALYAYGMTQRLGPIQFGFAEIGKKKDESA